MVQLRVDTSAVFSVTRISQTGKAGWLTPGKCYDIANGFDLSSAKVRAQVLEESQIAKPKLVVVCLPLVTSTLVCVTFRGTGVVRIGFVRCGRARCI